MEEEKKKWSKSSFENRVFTIDGEQYKYWGGVVNNTIPNGQGELHYPDGTKFEGSFKIGRKQGIGKLIYKNGGFVLGEWIDDVPDETKKWKIVYMNGDQYFGFIKIAWRDENGQELDNSSIPDKERDKFFENIKKLARLESSSKSNISFLPKLGNFLKHGEKGDLNATSQGVKYMGDFKNDKCCGFGVCLFANKNERYYGTFLDNFFHGNGTYVFSDGSFYVGNFVQGKRSGDGKLVTSSGDEISGKWVNGSYIRDCIFKKGNVGQLSMPTAKILLATLKNYVKDMKKQNGPTSAFGATHNMHRREGKNFKIRKWKSLVDMEKLRNEMNLFYENLKLSIGFRDEDFMKKQGRCNEDNNNNGRKKGKKIEKKSLSIPKIKVSAFSEKKKK